MLKLQLSGLDVVHDIIPKGIPSLHISQHTPNVNDIQSNGCLSITHSVKKVGLSRTRLIIRIADVLLPKSRVNNHGDFSGVNKNIYSCPIILLNILEKNAPCSGFVK